MSNKHEKLKLSPFGWGISLFTDMSNNIKSTGGVEKVREAIVGRLIDELWFAPEYGFKLLKRARRLNLAQADSFAAEIEAEILKDDRVASADVTLGYDAASRKLTVYIDALTSNNEQFTLIQTIDSVTGQLI